MEAVKIEVSGRVSQGRTDIGSKSERDAVRLEAADGSVFVLRKHGAPAFGDHSLDSMIGESVAVQGLRVGSLLLVDEWRFLADA